MKIWLVVSSFLKNISQIGYDWIIIPTIGENKNVPNHQPEMDWYVQEIARAYKSSIGHTRGIVRPCNRISGHCGTNMINMQQRATNCSCRFCRNYVPIYLILWYFSGGVIISKITRHNQTNHWPIPGTPTHIKPAQSIAAKVPILHVFDARHWSSPTATWIAMWLARQLRDKDVLDVFPLPFGGGLQL